MIRLEQVCRNYQVGGRPVAALRDVDLEIEPGAYLSVMGPSGSGKSTLLNILGCLDRPSAGSYQFNGRQTAGMSERELSELRRNRIGFVFQFFHLIPRLTATANVELPMIFAGIARAERSERAEQALAAVGLADRSGHRPDQLSGGEQQRVALARAVVMNPALLLADEPTGNLDSASGAEIIDLVESMNRRGLTLIVVTHDARIGERAGRRITLRDGRIAADESLAAR